MYSMRTPRGEMKMSPTPPLLYTCNRPHAGDGGDLLWIVFYVAFRHDKFEEHTPWDPEKALQKI
jgi:hypothetical protein